MSYDCTNFLGQRMQAMLASTSKGFAVVQPARLIRESSVLQHCWYAASGRHLASLSMSWSSTPFATLYITFDHWRFGTRPCGPGRIARISILGSNAQPKSLRSHSRGRLFTRPPRPRCVGLPRLEFAGTVNHKNVRPHARDSNYCGCNFVNRPLSRFAID